MSDGDTRLSSNCVAARIAIGAATVLAMAPGDGPSDDGADISTGSPGDEPVDAPPYVRSRTDPSVEGVWLRHRASPVPHSRGGPRLSTVVLVGAFVAVLVLYIVLRQGG